MKKRWLIAPLAALGVGVLFYWFWPRDYCRSAKSRYGLVVPQCPDGKILQKLRIRGTGLHRGGPGKLYVGATALYTVATADSWEDAPIDSFSVKLALVDAAGKETPIGVEKKWKHELGEHVAHVILPKVDDGDYKLRAEVSSKIGKDTIDLPLALYAPARVHVLTDRPLYEPGNEVSMRALVLRANDLSPIDNRPGLWVVRDPSGEVLLEEKAPAREWGVVAGTFPLDRGAPIGEWSVSWRSADAEDTVTFRVEPFTLPRFRVEAAAALPFYRRGDKPGMTGTVTYSSGAPVADAKLEIDWNVSGDWPPPTAWRQGGLPTRATTRANGRFELKLPDVPADLQGQVVLSASIAATDAAGDRVVGGASLLLSEDAIKVEAITDLTGGLVEGFNNRVYLRVTSADGRPLPGAEINVRRAWSGTDKGIDTALDIDAVGRVQLDPGPPVNVVIPARPYRPQPRGKTVTRVSAMDLLSRKRPSLADQVSMDKWLAPLEVCAKWVGNDSQTSRVVLRVDEGGGIVAADTGESELDRCVLGTIGKRRLARGRARVLLVGFQVKEPDLPELAATLEAPLGAPNGLDGLVNVAARDARDCLGVNVDEGKLVWAMSWQARKGSKKIAVAWIRDSRSGAVPAALARCIEGRLAKLALEDDASQDQLGFIRYAIGLPARVKQHRPQPTIMKGYELAVTATVDGELFGDTKLRMEPGYVPALRLRATPVLAKAGDEVTVELIRGPSFVGELPDKISIDHLGNIEEPEVDKKKRIAKFTIPADGKGWFEISTMGERALVFARSSADLAVTVTPDQEQYAPGGAAKLAIQTTIGGKGAPAAVGLFGVDDSLSQLAPLVGPDDLRRVRPEVEMVEKAFGTLDGQALVLGRIRGPNAAEATILRVSSIPDPAEVDAMVHGSADTLFDPVAELTDHFYVVLEELHVQTRIWEQTSGDELMEPKIMAKLWEKALDACKARNEPIEDAFGRRLRLHRLPFDLLELVDPRQVVVVGTKLPEDVENWSDWVMRRKP